MHKKMVSTFLSLFLVSMVLVSVGLGVESKALAGEEGVLGADVLRGGKPYEGVRLRFISLNYLFSQAIQKLVPEFEKGTGIKVDIEMYGTEDNLLKQVSELSLGGYAYDVVQVPPFNQAQYISAGWLTPLNNYLQDPEFTPLSFDVEDFFPAGMEVGRKNGIQYTLPIFSATILYYYRADIFEDYGIGEPAKDFNELLTITQKVNSEGISGIVLRGIPSIEENMWPFGLAARAYCGEEAFLKNDYRPNLTAPCFLEAVNLWKELFKYGPPGMNTFTHEEVISTAQGGLAAQWLDGHPLAGLFLDPEKSKVIDKLGVAKTPSGPKGWYPALSEHGIGIPKGSLNKDAAWEFIKWATSKEVMLEATQVTQYLSVTRRSAFNNPRYREKYNYFGGTFLKVTEETLNARSLYFPPILEWPVVGHIIARALSEATSGTKDTAAALKDANSTVERVMKDAGYFE